MDMAIDRHFMLKSALLKYDFELVLAMANVNLIVRQD